MLDATAAEPVELVVAERAPDRRADLPEIDAHESQQVDVRRPRRSAQHLDQPVLDILGSREHATHIDRQQVAVAHQREEEMLGAHVTVPELASMVQRRVDDRHGVRIAAIEHGSAPASATNVVLLVDGLPGDAQAVGDRLPRPAELPGVVDVEFLEFLDEIAKGGDGGEPDRGVAAVDGIVELGELPHDVSLG